MGTMSYKEKENSTEEKNWDLFYFILLHKVEANRITIFRSKLQRRDN